jgi:hypothetical protein
VEERTGCREEKLAAVGALLYVETKIVLVTLGEDWSLEMVEGDIAASEN